MMKMPHTRWKQEFFALVAPIAMTDPLSSILGAVEDGELIYYSYQDCVRLAGHACASVSSAFMATKLGLAELYGDQPPVRGEIEVRLAGERDQGATGPIGQVISFITGAATETGFKGLGGRYVRANRFIYDGAMPKPDGASISVKFTRLDTGESVTVHASPSRIPLADEERQYSALMPKVLQGGGAREERENFYKYWQGINRKILLETHPGVFVVTREG